MIVAVSPYHLTTREAPAPAAMLLADRVVTLLPVPAGGRDFASFERAAQKVPQYVALMRSWEWTMPLWRAGVISSMHEGDDAAADACGASASIARDDRFAALRPLMRPDLFDAGGGDESYLEALARDLLRGGPDPAVSVPLAAGMDRFARRHGMLAARSAAASIAQRVELRMGRRLAAAVLPAIVQASGERILGARARLAGPLAEVRAALGAAASPAGASAGCGIAEAAARYAREYESARGDLLGGVKPDEVRPLDALVRVTLTAMPCDAVLESSALAMSALDHPDGIAGAGLAGAGQARKSHAADRTRPSPLPPRAGAGTNGSGRSIAGASANGALTDGPLIAIFFESIAPARGRYGAAPRR